VARTSAARSSQARFYHPFLDAISGSAGFSGLFQSGRDVRPHAASTKSRDHKEIWAPPKTSAAQRIPIDSSAIRFGSACSAETSRCSHRVALGRCRPVKLEVRRRTRFWPTWSVAGPVIRSRCCRLARMKAPPDSDSIMLRCFHYMFAGPLDETRFLQRAKGAI